VNDADLSRLLVVAADSLERGGKLGFVGIIRQAAQRLAELHIDEPATDRCAGCRAEIVQPATGRRRRWCGRGRCAKTRDKSRLSE
jgi:hypothetical protein